MPAYRSARGWAIAAVVAAGVVGLVHVISALAVWPSIEAVRDNPIGYYWGDDATAYDVMALLKLLALLLAYVLTCLWLWQARSNAVALNPYAPHRRSRGWVWGAWVCPIVLYWFPFMVVSDVSKATSPQPQRNTLIGWWWGLWIAASMAMFIGHSLFLDMEMYDDLTAIRAFEVASAVLTLVALTVWALVVVRINREQEAAARPQAAPPAVDAPYWH